MKFATRRGIRKSRPSDLCPSAQIMSTQQITYTYFRPPDLTSTVLIRLPPDLILDVWNRSNGHDAISRTGTPDPIRDVRGLINSAAPASSTYRRLNAAARLRPVLLQRRDRDDGATCRDGVAIGSTRPPTGARFSTQNTVTSSGERRTPESCLT